MSDGYLSAVIAGLPATPTSGPQDIPTITSASSIGVFLPQVIDNGGSVLITYNLEMDDGQNGPFQSVTGTNSISL